MFENLTEDELRMALDQLVRCLGVREEIPLNDFFPFLRREDTQGCVQLIATKLGLPVRISVSYVSGDSKAGGTEGFRTTALARRGWAGRGTECIVAQVSIPQDLPMYGTRALQEYTVRVRVSRNCREYPSTLVTILAHELSHILLASLFYPGKDSELHTDLVPIVLGFHGIVRRGRKRIRTTERGGVETTQTTTYGYLTDSDFEFARKYVTNIVKGHQTRKTLLTALVVNTRLKLRAVTNALARFQIYLRYLDTHPPARMKPEESQKIVQCHALDYTDRWEAMITKIDTIVEEAEEFVGSLSFYSSSAVEKLEKYLTSLEIVSQELDPVTQRIKAHIIVLGWHVPLLRRIQIGLGKKPVKRFLSAVLRLYSSTPG